MSLPPPALPTPVTFGASPFGAWVRVVTGGLLVGNMAFLLWVVRGEVDAALLVPLLASVAAGGGWLAWDGVRLLRLGASALVLDADGFEDRRLGTGRIPWSAVRQLARAEVDVDGATVVVLRVRLHDPAAFAGRLRRRTRLHARLSRADVVVDLSGLRRADPDEAAEIAVGLWRLARRRD